MELSKALFMVGLIVLLSMFSLSNKDNFFTTEDTDTNTLSSLEGAKVTSFSERGDLGYFFAK